MESEFLLIHNDNDIDEEQKKMCYTCGGSLCFLKDNIFKCTNCGTIYNYTSN